ncbi:hypothetical protein [Qipengyuania sp. JC766]|uniref:hypothetical protein n=1 Tax=Qipengyuania sp. JC766 TaxID=3232139 RepID=UPI0034583CEC
MKSFMVPAVMILVIGIGVFFLPTMMGETDNAELVALTGQIGGALIGFGLVVTVIIFLKTRRR